MSSDIICSVCNKAWCDGKWHEVQDDVIDDILTRHEHPSMIMKALWVRASFEDEKRDSRRKDYLQECQNAESNMDIVLHADDSTKTDAGMVFNAVADDEDAVEGICLLPDSKVQQQLRGYCIGFSAEDMANPVGLVVFVSSNDTDGTDAYFPCLCPIKYLPKNILAKRKKFLVNTKNQTNYHDVKVMMEQCIKISKYDGSDGHVVPFLNNHIVDNDMYAALKQGLLHINDTGKNVRFKLALRRGLWFNEVSSDQLVLSEIRIDSLLTKRERVFHFRHAADGKKSISEISKAAKFITGERLDGKKEVLKALENKQLKEPTSSEKCIAYCLSGKIESINMGLVLACIGRAELDNHYHLSPCTCDINLNEVSCGKQMMRKLKSYNNNHKKDKD